MEPSLVIIEFFFIKVTKVLFNSGPRNKGLEVKLNKRKGFLNIKMLLAVHTHEIHIPKLRRK